VIDVVAGFIRRGDRILLQQRLPRRDYPLTWECPGGKIEKIDPNPAAALQRELDEELGDALATGCIYYITTDPFYVARFTAGQLQTQTPVRIAFHKVEISYNWQPKLLDASGLGWFTRGEMPCLDLIPGNIALCNWLRSNGMP